MKSIVAKYQFLFPLFLILLSFVVPHSIKAQSTAAPANMQNLNGVIFSIFAAIVSLIAFASLGMLVYGGYRYLSAGADKNSATQAQQTITYSLGGLIVTLCTWIILNLFGTFLGVNVSNFDLCITPGCV